MYGVMGYAWCDALYDVMYDVMCVAVVWCDVCCGVYLVSALNKFSRAFKPLQQI
jgi:hypothetical protein